MCPSHVTAHITIMQRIIGSKTSSSDKDETKTCLRLMKLKHGFKGAIQYQNWGPERWTQAISDWWCVAARIASSLRETEEVCINKPFSSEAQSGVHTNKFCDKACVFAWKGDPGIPRQMFSLSEKINIVKVALCKEWMDVCVQTHKPSLCWRLNRLLALFHIVIPVVYTFKYTGNQQRHKKIKKTLKKKR